MYKLNFSDHERLLEYRFKAYGAAFRIQNWFRNLKYRRKDRWRRNYSKFVAKLKREKILRRAIRKSRGYKFTRADLEIKIIRLNGICIVICRLIRGFLGRRRYKRLKIAFIKLLEVQMQKATVIQKTLRRTTVRTKYPLLGQRHRMLQAKRIRWERNNDMLRKYVQEHAENKTDDILSQDGSEDGSDDSNATDSLIVKQRKLFIPMQFLQRRSSFLFLNLKLGNQEYMENLNGPALKIQCCWRCKSARLRCKRKRNIQKFNHVSVISAWVHKIARKRRKLKALKIIQPVWRMQAQWRFLKQSSVVKIQSAWRTHITRKNFKKLLRLRYYCSLRLVHWARLQLLRRQRKLSLKRHRQLTELRNAGLSCFTATYTRWLAKYMWQGIRVKSYTSQHELQKVFQANSINGGLDAAKMVKLARECNGLLSDTLTANQIEIQFTKIKNPLEKRIDYSKFMDLIANLAILKFMAVDPSKVAMPDDAPTGTSAGTVTGAGTSTRNGVGSGAGSSRAGTTTAAVAASSASAGSPALPSDPNSVPASTKEQSGTSSTSSTAGAAAAADKIPINTFVFAGLKGRSALITRFVMEVLHTVPDYRRAVEYLDSKRLSATEITRLLMVDNVRSIQTFVRNRMAVRAITAQLAKLKLEKMKRRQHLAANVINGFIRGFLGRRFIKRLAQSMYTKFIDGATEREYWFNSRTNTSFWTKPALLGEFDCGLATRMPTPDEKYTVVCTSCNNITATCYCYQCDEPYCTMCYAMGHKSGQRKLHAPIIVDNCVQCEFQIGTRYCQSCTDSYCDSCFRYMHKKGRMRFHVSQRVCEVCDHCLDLSAQWVDTKPTSAVLGRSTGTSKLWCNRCFLQVKGEPAEAKAPYLTRLPFYGLTVKNYRKKALEEKRKKDISTAFETRKRELGKQKNEKAVRLVQRVYRGYCKRKSIADFIAMRKEFMRTREKETAQRENVLYQVSAVLGIAKALKGDTPLEKVMKLYPSYMHEILALSIDNNWSYACQLLAEHEERMKNAANSTLIQRIGARLKVSWHERQSSSAVQNYNKAAALFESNSKAFSMVCQVYVAQVVFLDVLFWFTIIISVAIA
jgi:hypothetical protein